MDRIIPEEEKKKQRYKRIVRAGSITAAGLIISIVLLLMLSPGVKRSALTIGKVTRGDIEPVVSASGHVVSSLEVIVSSPVSSSLLEIYCREGDEVEAGTPLMKLDLHTTEDEYKRISDQLSMKQNEIEQGKLNSETHLTDLEMKIRTKQMAADRLLAQLENERHLDSLGSGTGQRVHEAELAYKTACLEIAQMRRQLENERKVELSGARTRKLEAAIVSRSLEEARRTLDDAKICSPIRGTVTWLNTSIGASVSAGEKMAVISDLTRFKVEAELPEGHNDKVSIGSPVNIRVGKNEYKGRVSNLNQKSNSGVIKFSITFDSNPEADMKAGQNARVNVIYGLKENVIRIPYGSFYNGPGSYELFVVEGSNLKRKKIELGEASSEWIEVKEGVMAGDEIVTAGFDNIKNKSMVRLKR